MLGLVGGAVLDIYSSGLALLSAGLRIPRYLAALVDGVLMIAGSVYIVFFADDFLGQFMGFLTTLGVPIAAWCGIMLADLALRRRDYDEGDLYRPQRPLRRRAAHACCSSPSPPPPSAGAWSPTRPPSWLDWQGYLLDPLGLGGKSGAWAYANLGVLAALALGFLGTLALSRPRVRAQEAQAPSPADAGAVA